MLIAGFTGNLTIGKIGYGAQGYSTNNWHSINNGKDSQLTLIECNNITSVQTVGRWGDAFVIRFDDKDKLALYPKYCKVYIDGKLFLTGKKGARVGWDWFSYRDCTSSSNYTPARVFNEYNRNKTIHIKIDFFDKL